ncbi:methyltransferase domain-containing protein [Pseudoalteromonas distincta]|uniref:methyltransferase domain-containing protein n=1 Tax=Pseudoalteromonas distincta TaxID=77608 RepID=UPI002430E0B7|nr:methyltransferase domain-containing protein [Pseudoalteromonas distincta]
MHWEAFHFVDIIKASLPNFFSGKRVLEIGSYCVNHSIRAHFLECTYVGVDLTEGDTVDIIASGHEIQLSEKFDVVISCECFEHNPYYKDTLQNMLSHLRDDGLFIVSCATEGRPEHGTARTDPNISPGTSDVGWDYYKNLSKEDLEDVLIKCNIKNHYFFTNPISKDLYLIGLKNNIPSNVLIEQFENARNSLDQFIEQSITLSEMIRNVIVENQVIKSVENIKCLYSKIEHKFHPLFVNKFNNLHAKPEYPVLTEFLAEAYSNSIALYPGDYLAWVNCSKLELYRGDLNVALDSLIKAKKLNTFSYMLDSSHLSLLHKLKRSEEAINLSQKMEKKHLNDPHFYLTVAEIAKVKGDVEYAKASARNSFYLGNQSPRCYLIYIEALILNENYSDARSLLRGALNKHGHLPWIYFKKAKIASVEEKREAAIKILKLGLYHFPENKMLIDYLNEVEVTLT